MFLVERSIVSMAAQVCQSVYYEYFPEMTYKRWFNEFHALLCQISVIVMIQKA